MTDALPIRIADAVVAELNAGIAAAAFQLTGWAPERRYFDWDLEYGDLEGLAVNVVYLVSEEGNSRELVGAGYLGLKAAVDVVVRKRFGSADRLAADGRLRNDAVDPLVTLLEELQEYFIGRRLSGPLTSVPEANWEESPIKSWVNQGKLRFGLFEGVVRIEFDAMKAI